jgi:periplasmic protein TonB
MKRYMAILLLHLVLIPPVFCSQDASKTSPPSQDTPPAKPSTQRIRMEGKMMAKQIKHVVAPVYPQQARAQNIQGLVRLHAIIDAKGRVQQLTVVSGHYSLRQAAVDAVSKWEYKPVLSNGEPAEVDTTVDVIFSIGN